MPLRADVLHGEPDPIEGWVSPDYGRQRPAPALVYSATARLPLRIATLLLPIEDPSAEAPSVSMLLGEGTGPVALHLKDRGETVRFGAREAARGRAAPARDVELTAMCGIAGIVTLDPTPGGGGGAR